MNRYVKIIGCWLVLLLAGLVFTTSCRSQAANNGDAADILAKDFDLYRNGDIDGFLASLDQLPPNIDFTSGNFSDTVKQAMRGFTYTIQKSSVDGDNASFTLSVTAIDLKSLITTFISETLNEQINAQTNDGQAGAQEDTQAGAGDTAQTNGSQGGAGDTDAAKADSNAKFDAMVSAPDVPRVTKTVAVQMTRINGEWKLVADDALYNMLTGFHLDLSQSTGE